MYTQPQEPLGFAADFRVGDWLVEPSLDRVSRAGTVLRLRPQLVDLLVLLAQHAGRTVSKETILEKVWVGQHVAESGMTRCIAEIRRALGDDAREPRIVETIPKRGYRLVAPVVFLDAGGVAGIEEIACPPPAGAEPAAARSRPSPEPIEAPPQPPWLLRTAGWPLGSTLGVIALFTTRCWRWSARSRC